MSMVRKPDSGNDAGNPVKAEWKQYERGCYYRRNEQQHKRQHGETVADFAAVGYFFVVVFHNDIILILLCRKGMQNLIYCKIINVF